MKNAIVGDYLLWDGKPAEIIGEIDRRAVVIKTLEDKKCPHCNESLGKEQFTVVVSAPLFQENAESMPTIDDDPTIEVK